MSSHPIPVVQLEEMARESNVEFRPGDIPIIRTGWTKWYDEAGFADRKKYVIDGYDWVGIEGCEEMMEWLWNHHFAAIATDANGVERVPFNPEWSECLFPGWPRFSSNSRMEKYRLTGVS